MIKILSAQNYKELIKKKRKLGEERFKNTQIRNKLLSCNRKWMNEEGKVKRDTSKKSNTMAQYSNLSFKNNIKINLSLLKKKEKLITERKVYSSNAIKEIQLLLKKEFKLLNSRSNNKKLTEKNEQRSLLKESKFQQDLSQAKNMLICSEKPNRNIKKRKTSQLLRLE